MPEISSHRCRKVSDMLRGGSSSPTDKNSIQHSTPAFPLHHHNKLVSKPLLSLQHPSSLGSSANQLICRLETNGKC